MNELQNLLVSGKPLWITVDGFRQAMLSVFPLHGKIDDKADPKSALGFSKAEIETYLKNHTWYQFETHTALQELIKVLAQEEGSAVTLTDEFDDEQHGFQTDTQCGFSLSCYDMNFFVFYII